LPGYLEPHFPGFGGGNIVCSRSCLPRLHELLSLQVTATQRRSQWRRKGPLGMKKTLPACRRGGGCRTHPPAPHPRQPYHREAPRPAFVLFEASEVLDLESRLRLAGGPDDPASSPHLCVVCRCSDYFDYPPGLCPNCVRCRCCRGSFRLGCPSSPLKRSRCPFSYFRTKKLLAFSPRSPPLRKDSSPPLSCFSSLAVPALTALRSLEALVPRLPGGRAPCLSGQGEPGEVAPPRPPHHLVSPWKR